MKRFFFIIVILIISRHTLVAQYDAQLSNYWAAFNYFNPAYAGQSGNLEATALGRTQWLGVQGAPRTGLVSGDMPLSLLGRVHGVGAIMFTEKIGLLEHTIISGQYAYKKDLWKGKFSVGIQVGYIKEAYKGSDLYIPTEDEYHNDQDESLPNTDLSGSGIDVGFGLFYSKPKWYVGLSTTHITQPRLQLNDNVFIQIPRAYYLTGGYNIQLNNPLLELRPSLLVKSTQPGSRVGNDSITGKTISAMMTMTQIDLSLRMIYNKSLWGGLGWRKGDAAVVMLGGKFKMIEAGYAYDFPISDMIQGTAGSHEIFIKYIVDLSLKKGDRNKHKSVRIL